MLAFGRDAEYGIDRLINTFWTFGYTIFAQDLHFVEYPGAPVFAFPGRLPAENQLLLIADFGSIDSDWMCQGPLSNYAQPDYDNYRCRMRNSNVTMTKGCSQCYLRFTNENGDSFAVFNVRSWLVSTPSLGCSMVYFNSEETITKMREVMITQRN